MDHFRKDWPLYAFIGGYALLVCLTAVSIGQSQKIVAFLYLYRWFGGAPYILAALSAWIGLRACVDPKPVRRLKSEIAALLTAEKAAGLLLFFAIAIHHGMYTSAKTMLPHLTTFHADQALARIDGALHGGDPWRYLTFLNPITDAVSIVYVFGWFIPVVLFPLAACMLKAMRPVRDLFLWTYVLTWPLLGNLMAGLFLSGGPMFYQRLYGDDRFGTLIDHLGWFGEGAESVPARLWKAYEQDISGLGTGISAFPSLHVAMATLFALTARRIDPRFGAVMNAFLAFVVVGSVHLGWHYAIDGYASMILTFALWKIVGWALSRRPGVSLVTEAQPA